MLQWLMDSGLVFYGPALEEPHRVPRMHNVVPSSKAFPFHLGRQCLKAGVNIKLSMSLDRFLTKEGRVIGVEAISEGHAKVQFHAKKAVIVASGDFSGGQVLKKEYASELAAAAGAVNVTNTGDGHRAALAIGASIINGDLTHGPLIRFVPKAQPNWLELIPPYSWIGHLACWAMKNLPFKLIRPAVMSFLTTALGPDKGLYTQGAILVNKWGQRFSNEKDKPALDLVSQPDRIGYIIMNAAIAKKFNQLPHFISTAPTVAYAFMDDYRKSRPDIYTEASSIEELARRLKMQPEVLSAAVDSTSNNAIPLTGPGFVALGPVKSYVVMTEGGLAVNESHQVLGNDAKVISGLYAVGSAGQGGLLLPGHGHHLGWAFVSGRRAGKLAALSS
jgi:succinate dehydrogenase/fumarate reductase flavoprotein subunit